MKRAIIISISLFFLNSLIAQKCSNFSLGTKTPYKSQQVKTNTPLNNYTAVFINHVGRHGARHLTKDVNASLPYNLLMKADSSDALTAEGKRLKQMVLLLEKIEKKDFKSISQLGKIEQQEIAKRMLINNSTVFKNSSPVVKIRVTKEVRTVQSADAFLNGMKQKINTEDLTKEVDDTTLRFYDLAPSYLAYEKNGNWKTSFTKLQQLEKYSNITQEVCKRFVTSGFLENLSNEDKDEFASDIYGFATIINSIEKEIQDAGLTVEQVNFQSFFSCKELDILSKINEAEDFLLKGPGMDANGIQVKIAAPLLTDFIKTTDGYIQTRAVNVQLRFTHAEAIAPFAALLDLASAAKAINNISNINSVWNASAVVPLSANIQWILYKKNGSDDYLIKVLLNEKNTAIDGLKTKNFPYYNWGEVRAFYLKKLNTLNAALDGNGFAFLQSVK